MFFQLIYDLMGLAKKSTSGPICGFIRPRPFCFGRFVHHSIENFMASKNMCSLNLFEAFVSLKNWKNLKSAKYSIFRLSFIKLNFLSFVQTYIIQTTRFLFNFENWTRKWLERRFRPWRLLARAVRNEATKTSLPILANFSEIFLKTLELKFLHGSTR